MAKLVAITTLTPFPNTEFILGKRKGLKAARKIIATGEPVGVEIYQLQKIRGYNGIAVEVKRC